MGGNTGRCPTEVEGPLPACPIKNELLDTEATAVDTALPVVLASEVPGANKMRECMNAAYLPHCLALRLPLKTTYPPRKSARPRCQMRSSPSTKMQLGK